MSSPIRPIFTPAYDRSNQRSICWGNDDLIVYATGCAINIDYYQDKKLLNFCPIEIPPHTITSIDLHKSKRRIAVGNEHGDVYVINLDSRKPVASAIPLRIQDSVAQVKWLDDNIMVLLKSGHVKCLTIKFGNHTDTLRNFAVEWSFKLGSKDFIAFDIEPLFNKELVFISNQNFITLYRFENGYDKPTPIEKNIILPIDKIEDVQFSIHFYGYIFVVSHDIGVFHIETSSYRTAFTPPYSAMMIAQNLSDPSITVICRNSAMMMFEFNNGSYVLKYETPVRMTNKITSVTFSPRNKNLAVLYNGVGLYIYTEKLFCLAYDKTKPSSATCVDYSGEHIAIGTVDGCILLFSKDGEIQSQIYVSKEKVDTLTICGKEIIFLTSGHYGRIYLETHEIVRPKQHGTVLNIFVGRNGYLVIQRADTALGIFVNGNEKPILMDDVISDVFVDDDGFVVLLATNEIHTYNKEGKEERCFRSRGVDGRSVSFCRNANMMVTTYNMGALHFFDFETKTPRKVHTTLRNPRKLCFKGDTLIGLNGTTLFQHTNGATKECPYPVLDYALCGDNIIVACSDGIVRFIDSEKWQTIQTKNFPPTRLDLLKKLKDSNGSMHNFSACVRDNTGLPFGPEFENFNYEFLQSSESHKERALACLFVGSRGEAVEALMADGSLFSLSLAANLVLLQSMDLRSSKDGLNLSDPRVSQAVNILKDASLTADDMDSALLLRVAQLDSFAVGLFLERQRFDLALRFCGYLRGEERDKALLSTAIGLVKSHSKLAARIFAECAQYHGSLWALLKDGWVPDAWLLAHGRSIFALPDDLCKANEIPGVEELRSQIDNLFEKEIAK